jgi:hypothetical protein
MATSEIGTFETCRPTLKMSAHWGGPEVVGRLSKRPTADVAAVRGQVENEFYAAGIAPKDNCSPGRKSDAILREKPPCQQLNEGENDALTPTRRARHYRVLRNHGCRDT